MKELYYIPKNVNREIIYKYSEYSIEQEPLRSRRKSLANHIDKYILKERFQNNPIKNIKPLSDWVPPPPIYTGRGIPTPD